MQSDIIRYNVLHFVTKFMIKCYFSYINNRDPKGDRADENKSSSNSQVHVAVRHILYQLIAVHLKSWTVNRINKQWSTVINTSIFSKLATIYYNELPDETFCSNKPSIKLSFCQ